MDPNAHYPCDSKGRCPDPEQICLAGICEIRADKCISSCQDAGANCGLLPDRCGGQLDCGGCPVSWTCGGAGTPHVCGCIAETDIAYCGRLGKNCGTVSAADNCGVSRAVSCGSCPSGRVCSPGFVCGCQPETDQDYCNNANFSCGIATGVDLCGMQRQFDCGSCDGGFCSGAGGSAGLCCRPESSLAMRPSSISVADPASSPRSPLPIDATSRSTISTSQRPQSSMSSTAPRRIDGPTGTASSSA